MRPGLTMTQRSSAHPSVASQEPDHHLRSRRSGPSSTGSHFGTFVESPSFGSSMLSMPPGARSLPRSAPSSTRSRWTASAAGRPRSGMALLPSLPNDLLRRGLLRGGLAFFSGITPGLVTTAPPSLTSPARQARSAIRGNSPRHDASTVAPQVGGGQLGSRARRPCEHWLW